MICIEDFETFWNNVGDKSRLNGNGYRILIDLALYGSCTQKEFRERRNWEKGSISKSFKRLYEEGFLYCLLKEDRKILYCINKELFNERQGCCSRIAIDMPTFLRVWNVIIENTKLSANTYRILLDIVIYGATTQSELCERRRWIQSSVNTAFKKLSDMKLITRIDKKRYIADIDFILNEKKEEY